MNTEDMKTCIHTKTCKLFISVLFVMGGQNPKYQWTREWIIKFWYIHTLESLLATKRSKCWCMQQDGWIFKALYKVKEASLKVYLLHDPMSQKGRSIGTESGSLVPGALNGEHSWQQRSTENCLSDGNVPYSDCVLCAVYLSTQRNQKGKF